MRSTMERQQPMLTEAYKEGAGGTVMKPPFPW
jgi:hypothetical protein